jgi:hypothetical protein
MKAIQACLAASLLLLMASCSKTDYPTTANNATTGKAGSLLKTSGPSASGQGRIEGTDRVFAFNARTQPDGTVKGEGQLTYTHNGNDVKIHFMIDCLSVVDNVAAMSGTVTNSNTFQPGGPCWFKVKDNGEGNNAPPDEMTGFLFCEGGDEDPACAQLTCGNDLGLALNPIENGNIQVRP